MEVVEEDVVIVGAGIAGLTTSLGLHKLGIRSLVLESSESLRATGFAFTTWTNAWRALDAVGIADLLRPEHLLIQRIKVTSIISGEVTERMLETKGKQATHEFRCVKRKLLLEALEKALPSGTVRFSSKVVSIEESGHFKLLQLADGTILKTKVLVGCDGVNSLVAKWLGFKKPEFVGRSAIRGYADYKGSHGFEPKFQQYFGKGIRTGFIPCDNQTVYWYFTWINSNQDEELEDNPVKIKQFVLSKVPEEVKAVVENTPLDYITASPLRFRHPWEILRGNISKGSVCVAGDALHPMTADIGQGACSALEDGIVLARCITETLNNKEKSCEEKEEFMRIEMGLKKFADERRWRSFQLISIAYVVGFIQQKDNMIVNLLRDKILSVFLGSLLRKIADFDCGKLIISQTSHRGT